MSASARRVGVVVFVVLALAVLALVLFIVAAPVRPGGLQLVSPAP